MTIAISGFLSQGDKIESEWKKLTEYTRQSKTGIFAYKWESKSVKDLAIAGGAVAAKIAGGALVTYLTGGTFTLLKCAMLGINVKGFNTLFEKAKESAKLSGVLLACALAIGFPFYTQTISLVSFSLGCQVSKSCIKTLHSLGANEVIQNVTFLGGAT